MSTVNSLFKDPSVNFVWWIEGDKIAIATTGGDGGTTLTAKGNYKAPIIGTTSSFQADGETRNLLAEDLDSSETTVTVDYGAAFVVGDIFLAKSSKSIFNVLGSISTHLIFKPFAKIGQLEAVQVIGVARTSSPGCKPGHF